MKIDDINKDLKTAMLSGDKQLVEVLKGLKTAIQYLAVSKGVDNPPSEDEVIGLMKKEQKKRVEAAELYKKANESERTAKELYEKQIIAKYLPDEASEDELQKIIDVEISKIGGLDSKNMGQIIGAVKQVCGPAADGSLIAQLVKGRL